MKLGIIGAGTIVTDFLTITPQIESLELEAICGTAADQAAMERFQKQYGIGHIYYNFDDLLKGESDTIYIALPNHLHYRFAKQALMAKKNVIVEKPFTLKLEEAKELVNYSKENQCFLFEAITTLHLPNYKKIKELLPTLGDVKIVQCNYSQYSRRYDAFKNGKVLPAFDPACGGGALMDLNIYNIHYTVGLFGEPKHVNYYPNMERGVDTSGILVLDYDTFKCVCIAAKDCKAPISYNIQGDKACIHHSNPANVLSEFKVLTNDGTVEDINVNGYDHRMVDEFNTFIKIIENNDSEQCHALLDHTLKVSQVVEKIK